MSNLREKNSRGLIHAPDESEELFLKRCRKAKHNASAPTSAYAKELFDIEPDWVHLRYSDQRLRLWEGGCTWIEEDQVTLQLRKAFEHKTRYLGYTSKEIIAHELVHVVRNSFEEPIFEEVLAYRTSPSRLRRYFGPIFRSPTESLIFMSGLGLAFVATFFTMLQLAVYLGVLGIVAYGTARLVRTQHIFAQARAKIAELVGEKQALPVMVRLTDREIIRFSSMEREQIAAYAIKMSRTQLRWQQIRHSYINQDV